MHIYILEDDSDDDDDNDENISLEHLDVGSLNAGQFVLYKWQEEEFYLGTVADIRMDAERSEVTIDLMKKYGTNGKNVHFVWSPLAHKVVIDDLAESQCVFQIGDPSFDRRGTTVIYSVAAFGPIPLKDIH